MVTRHQVDNARPEVVIDLARHWAAAATTMETAADDYRGFIDKPGGQYWEGETAEAAQGAAAEDRRAVISMSDALSKLSTDTVNTISSSVMPALTNVRQLIANVEKKPGFTVNNDLSVTYTAPEGTSEKTAKACKDAVEDMAQQIQDAANSWWQADQHAADQITGAARNLPGHFNPLAGTTDPAAALRALQMATNQAVVDQLAKVKAAKQALDAAMSDAYVYRQGDPRGQAAIAKLADLKADYVKALDDLGNIPDYSNLDPKSMSASADGHFLLGYTADGQPVQATGQLKNGSGEIFDQAKQTYFTFQDGKLVGTRRLDQGKVTPDDELLFNAVTTAVGAPEAAAALKLGGEAALQGLKTFFGREALDGSASGAAALTAENVLPKAMAAAETRADTAAHNLALEHADDIARPHTPSPAAGTTDHPPPLTEHHTPLPPDTPGHPTSVDGRGHPGTSGSGDHPIANPAPDGLDHHIELGPQPPPTINDINRWLPEINHGPGMDITDPARGMNCGDCAAAVEQRLTGQIPDATAGLNTLSIQQMEASTGLMQVPGTPNEIAQYLIDRGPGAHTVIGVDRAGAPGHWFNAYYDGKNVYAVDAQTGTISGWPPNMDAAGFPVTNWDYGVPKK